MRIRDVALLFATCLLAAGCDHSGIHPLGSRRDVTTNCARSTWVRTTDLGTELFLFGAEDPTVPSAVDPQTDEPVPSCFVRAFVGLETSTTLEQGTYVVDAAGTGTFEVDAVYTYKYEPDLNSFTRYGSKRNDMPDPATHAIAISASGEQLLVTFDGEARRLTNFRRVLARFGSSTQAEAEEAFSVFNLHLYTSLARLIAFQTAGMTQYIGNLVTYQAMVSSSYTVVVNGISSPQNVFVFTEYEDLNGFVIDGTQTTNIDAAITADGTMSGALSFEMHGLDDLGEDTVLRGWVDYGDLIVDNGIAGGGFYTFGFENGPEYTIDWDLGDVIDLRSVLPVSEGQP